MREKTLTREAKAIAMLVLPMALACCMIGCGKEQPPAEEDRSSPKSYMKDKEFIGRLEKQKSGRAQLKMKHIEAMEAYKAAHKDDPTDAKEDTKALKARVEAIEREYMASRQKTFSEVRERIAPKKQAPANGGSTAAGAAKK